MILYRWLWWVAVPTVVGLCVVLANANLLADGAGLVLLALGIAAGVRCLQVSVIVQLGQMTVRNHLRTVTFPLTSIQAIGATQVTEYGLLRSYGRLVVTDGEGNRWPLKGTTGEGPEIVRLLVHDLQEAAPDVTVDVDLAWFPHDRDPDRGKEHLGLPPQEDPPPVAPGEQQRRRQKEGRAEAAHLRAELDRIQANKRSS